MNHNIFSRGLTTALLMVAGTVLVMNAPVIAQQYKILHNFNCTGIGACGPAAGLVFDHAGNLFGTTSYGGLYNGGTVFELSPETGGNWTEKILYSFNPNGTDAYNPQASLFIDAAHNLYGTTPSGGSYDEGTVFEVSPKTGGGWSEKVLLAFGGSDTQGFTPNGGVIADSSGNLSAPPPTAVSLEQCLSYRPPQLAIGHGSWCTLLRMTTKRSMDYIPTPG